MNQSFGSCYDPHLSSIFLLLTIANSNMIDAQGQTVSHWYWRPLYFNKNTLRFLQKARDFYWLISFGCY